MAVGLFIGKTFFDIEHGFPGRLRHFKDRYRYDPDDGRILLMAARPGQGSRVRFQRRQIDRLRLEGGRRHG